MPHTYFKHCGFVLGIQYGMFYTDWCEQSGGQERVFEGHSPVLLPPMQVKCSILHAQLCS